MESGDFNENINISNTSYLEVNQPFLEFIGLLEFIFKENFQIIEFSFQFSKGWRAGMHFANAKEFKRYYVKEKPQLCHMSKGPLAFDCDIGDYCEQRICSCGSNKEIICPECWYILRVSMKILLYILKKKFGFEKVYFFFSGRRGYHAFVMDYINLSTDNIKRIYNRCIPYYLDPYLFDNNANNSIFKDFLDLQKGALASLKSIEANNPAFLLDLFKTIVKDAVQDEGLFNIKKEKNIDYCINVLCMFLPRLDMNLAHADHKIKIPFQKHPETKLYGSFIGDTIEFMRWFDPFTRNLNQAKIDLETFKLIIERDYSTNV